MTPLESAYGHIIEAERIAKNYVEQNGADTESLLAIACALTSIAEMLERYKK